jgi:hypothetical protein
MRGVGDRRAARLPPARPLGLDDERPVARASEFSLHDDEVRCSTNGDHNRHALQQANVASIQMGLLHNGVMLL